MKMNKVQMENVLKKLNSHSGTCHVCKSSGLKISDKIFELREFNDGNLVVSSDNSVMPLVAGLCGNCGHIQYFSAIKLGAIDTSEKKVNDENDKSKTN